MWLLAHTFAVLGLIAGLVVVRRILADRRAPASALAWLLVIFLVPYLGLPLYLVFGARKLRRSKPAAQDSSTDASAAPRGPMVAPLERMLQSHGIQGATERNTVQLIPNGEEAFCEVLALIEEARHSIYVTTFILGRDEVGAAVLARLAHKAASGVHVRLLVDGLFAGRFGNARFADLATAGGRWARFMPVLHLPFRGHANMRNHRKTLIVDGGKALVGGMNLATEYMGPRPDPRRWRDVILRLSGPAVADLVEVFRSDWSFTTGEGLPAPVVAEGCGAARVQVVASGPDTAGDALYDLLLSLAFEAVDRLWIATPYFIPDEALERALALAVRRGVDVRIIVPARSNHALTDWAGGTYLRELQDLGARIQPFVRGMMHAKAMLIDRVGIVGSANADLRSLLLDYEVAVLLGSPSEIDAMTRWFEALLVDCGSDLPTPTRSRRAVEAVGRLVAPLV